MTVTLRILRPASRETSDLLAPRLLELQAQGFALRYDDLPSDPTWTYTAGAAAARAAALTAALEEAESDIILCARGGYGSSDLLPLLPWAQLRALKPKLLIGFSDISALHSAFYTQLGWAGLHGPMPATGLWGKDGEHTDTAALLSHLQQWTRPGGNGSMTGTLSVAAVMPRPAAEPCRGLLFGGCFTVLTNLIGTPYLPQTLDGHILFIEDTDEHPARLMRALNQWLQAGRLEGVKALVIGHLRHLGASIPDSAPFVLEQFAARTHLPVFHSPLFGHTSPNMPLAIGAQASIHAGQLTWHLSQPGNANRSTRDLKV